METELKFALSAQARDKVERHVLRSAVEHEPTVETDHTTYFDTPERALKRAGFSLRILIALAASFLAAGCASYTERTVVQKPVPAQSTVYTTAPATTTTTLSVN